MAQSIRNCVQKFRLEFNLTQAELADKIGVTRQTVCALERGDYIPSVLLAIKIADFFKQPVKKIFSVRDCK